MNQRTYFETDEDLMERVVALVRSHQRYIAMSPQTRTSPCPDCGLSITWLCDYDFRDIYPISPDNLDSWWWECRKDFEVSACQCVTTLNVETWEGQRVVDALVAGDDMDVIVEADNAS